MKKHWNLKVIAGVMALALVLGGCTAPAAGSSSSGGDVQTESKADASKEETASAGDGPVSPEGEFPIVSEKIELKVMVPNQSNIEDLATNSFTEEYEEKTNIKINWNIILSDSVQDKVNISLSSGDMPDIYLGCNVTQTQQLAYGSQGAFLSLNGYIDQYGAKLKEIMQHVPNLEQVITMGNGNIYALPRIEKCPHCEVSNKMWVNRDWLKALNLKTPTTTEEFEDMLKAFKENDPNGNGQQDEIPLITYEKGWNTSPISGYLMNPFVYTQPSNYTYLDNGKINTAYTQDGWKDGLMWLNKLYNEGLYYDQSLVLNEDQARQIGQSGGDVDVVGCYLSGVPSAVPGDPIENWRPYVCLPPLEGPAGRVVTWGAYSQINPTHFVITSACKTPEAAFRWGEEMYDNDLTYRVAFGVEGENWKKIVAGEDGIPADAKDTRGGDPAEVSLNIDGVTWGDKQNFCWRGIGLRCDTTDFKENRYAQYIPGDYETELEYRVAEDTINVMEPYRPKIDVVVPPVVYSDDQAMELANVEAVVLSYVEEMAARFITGDAKPEEWDAYIAELKNKGIDKLQEIYQAAYDAKYK